MPNKIEGSLKGDGQKVGIVVSRFNDFITRPLLDGAVDCLLRHGVIETDIDVVYVPGAFEIPSIAKKMCGQGKYDAVICLGAVIRGATAHFDYVAGEASKGIGILAMESSIPVVFGVLTTNTLEQAIERSGSKSGNKGWEAALTAIEMINLSKLL